MLVKVCMSNLQPVHAPHLHIIVWACLHMAEFMHSLCVWGRTNSFTIHIHVPPTHLMMSASQRDSNFTVQLLWDCVHFQMEHNFPLPRLLYNDIFWLSKPGGAQHPQLCYCTDKKKAEWATEREVKTWTGRLKLRNVSYRTGPVWI